MRWIAAAVVFLLPATAHASPWFPVQGDATIGGSFGHHGIFNANLYVGYANGFRFKPDGHSGMLFSAGPTFTYRGFNRESLACPPLAKDQYDKEIPDGCGDGHSWGLQARAGIAFITDDEHEVPDHYLYVGISPFRGSEPRLQLSDGRVYDRSATGFRVTFGYNYMAFSRAIVAMDMKGKDDAGLILLYPLALLNKFELHYEQVTVSDGQNDHRWGFATGFGF
jgi:hypothetical protein